MKKLIIAAAIVCAAALSQAASFSWYSNDAIYGIGNAALEAGLAANKGYAADGDTIDDLSWTLAYTLVFDNGVTTDTLTGDLMTAGDGTVWMEEASALVVANAELGYQITYTATITDGQGGSWDITSNTMTGDWTVQGTGDMIMYAGDTVSTWTTAPEPTSGLLLLLGVGALALRRRRA